jgi:hypothetical protein
MRPGDPSAADRLSRRNRPLDISVRHVIAQMTTLMGALPSGVSPEVVLNDRADAIPQLGALGDVLASAIGAQQAIAHVDAVDERRADFGIELICATLGAASAYYQRKTGSGPLARSRTSGCSRGADARCRWRSQRRERFRRGAGQSRARR